MNSTYEPGRAHHLSKLWRLQTPTGEVLEVTNLKDYIRKHPELFAKEGETADLTLIRAARGIGLLGRSYSGTRGYAPKTWRGWKVLGLPGKQDSSEI